MFIPFIFFCHQSSAPVSIAWTAVWSTRFMIQYVLIIFIPVAEVPGDGSSTQVRPLIIKSLWSTLQLQHYICICIPSLLSDVMPRLISPLFNHEFTAEFCRPYFNKTFLQFCVVFDSYGSPCFPQPAMVAFQFLKGCEAQWGMQIGFIVPLKSNLLANSKIAIKKIY